MVSHLTFNQLLAGSNPVYDSKFDRRPNTANNFYFSRIEKIKSLVWSLRIAGIEKGRLTCLISMVSAGSTPAPASKFTEDRLQQTKLKILLEKFKRIWSGNTKHGKLANLVKRLTVNQRYQGSNP